MNVVNLNQFASSDCTVCCLRLLLGHEAALSRCTGVEVSCRRSAGVLLWAWRKPVRGGLCDDETDQPADGIRERSVSTTVLCLRAGSHDRLRVCFTVLLFCGCVRTWIA